VIARSYHDDLIRGGGIEVPIKQIYVVSSFLWLAGLNVNESISENVGLICNDERWQLSRGRRTGTLTVHVIAGCLEL